MARCATNPSTKSPGLLFPHAETVILTEPRQPRAISATLLAEMTGHHARKIEIVADPSAALERALALAQPDDAVFATGSLYLVGDLLTYWHHRAQNSRRSVLFVALISPSCSLSWRMIGWAFHAPRNQLKASRRYPVSHTKRRT